MKETALYLPVKSLLESLGFDVYAEAINCDVIGRKQEELVIVELKKTLNLELLSQGVQRQKITNKVFLCVPEKEKKNKALRLKEQVIRRLGLGLITVYTSPIRTIAKIVFEPQSEDRVNLRERQKLLVELENRSIDPNTGGSTKVPIYTAYKETSVVIANILKKIGPTKLKNIRRFAGKRADSILSKNFYGWFERVKRGEYAISETGVEELKSFKEINELLCRREEFRLFCEKLTDEKAQ